MRVITHALVFILSASHLERRALDGNKRVDGNTFRVFWQCGKLVKQAHAVHRLFAQPDDAARAHADAGVAHRCQRCQAVL